MKLVQFDLYKGFGISVAIHLLFFTGFGFYSVKSIQSTPVLSTVKVSFISMPEELQQQTAVPEEITPPETVKSMVLEKKEPKKKKIEKKPVVKKVEAPKPIQKTKPVTLEKKIVPPIVVKHFDPEMKAVSTVSPAQGYLTLNLAGITEKIQENLIYPRMARKMGWTGKVLVTFLITQSGEARDIEIATSSGRSLLDRAVIDALQRISNFPIPRTPVSVTVPISFFLQ